MGMGSKLSCSDGTTKWYWSYSVRWYFQSILFDQIVNWTKWNNWWILRWLWITFPDDHTVVKGHYLEVHKRLKNVTLLYEDVSKVVAVSSYCITSISPELNTIDGKQKGRIIPLFEITNYVDEILLGLVTQYTF